MKIENFKLTPEDYRKLESHEIEGLPGLTYRSPQEIADAQLAKALWGFQEYMSTWSDGSQVHHLSALLELELEAAGIPRPEVNLEA